MKSQKGERIEYDGGAEMRLRNEGSPSSEKKVFRRANQRDFPRTLIVSNDDIDIISENFYAGD